MTDNQKFVAAMDALARSAKMAADSYRHRSREIPVPGATFSLKCVAYQAVNSLAQAASAMKADAAYIENVKLEEAVDAAFFDANECWSPFGGHDEYQFGDAA